jgi:acyl-CoA synthetase (AMP-forming)/AMP-acid ligase II/acyl carrier protein
LLRDWLIKNNITITFLPTILAESIIKLEWPETTSLRFLLTGADTLHHYPSPTLPFALINNYGPTEATVVTTSGRIFPTEHPDAPPSIGRSIANTQVYILNEQLHQVPIGEVGELHIGGAGVAKGYLGRSELTAEKFIAHPFNDEPGARLYKTGDLARYLPDGQIAFVGRTDYQVKIRGYRIETNEIVLAINQHPHIHASIVVAHEDATGEKRLIAYIVFAPGEYIGATSLRETLAIQLPDYMIPTTFVVLESLPQTSNGKVDRSALPTPDETNTLYDEITVLPTTPLEEHLVKIVAPLLGITQVGIDDNFFMLGGHSLLGTQVIMQVAETFGIDLSLRTLFEAPTVRLLASEIEQLIIAKIEMMSDEEALRLLE